MSKSVKRDGASLIILIGLCLNLLGVASLFTNKPSESTITLFVLGTLMILFGKMLPQLEGDFEFGPKGLKGKFKRLRNEVEEAQRTKPQTEEAGKKEAGSRNSKTTSEEIIEEAGKSPRAALIRLSFLIEKEVRLLLAKTNWLSPDSGLSFSRIIKYIEERKFFTPPLISSLKVFWDLRNDLIHSKKDSEESNKELISAIDIGLTILKMIEGIPHEINIVYHPGVAVFADNECKVRREGILGLILDTTSPGGVRHEKRIFPTRKKYKKGQQLSWEWSFDNVFLETWYKDPDSGKVKPAWNSSAEFIGRPLEEIA